MNKLAFLYAGQGAQKVGAGQDFYETYPAFREILDHAPVDFDLKKVSFEGPEETLNDTRYTQPSMVAFAAGVTHLLYDEGIRPSYAAGLSLGEYSALHAAGVFDAQTAISLVAFRGKAMAEAVTDRPCKMIAVMNLDRMTLQEICERASDYGVVEISNYNCPGQLVVGGDAGAVERAAVLAVNAGARKVVPLKVSGPFHTSLMKPASQALHEKFKTISMEEMRFPVLFNCRGDLKRPEDTIPELLEKQVCSSVYLEDTIHRMADLGVDTVVEIGPGRALSNFVRRTEKGITCYSVETVADLERTVSALKEVCSS